MKKPSPPPITKEAITEWVKQVVIADNLAPTCLHAIYGTDMQTEAYFARNNPPDVLELAIAYLNLIRELEGKR